ncbi:hypothetical protein F8S13_22375 [Chloroflexia bacterium SDU3-3]|nr:hypothetical protein F8S13_22375 [Chloroflexia bacterium SDU3-3]
MVRRLEQRCPWGDTPPSDHAYVYAELEWTGPTEPTECQTIRGRISQLNTRLGDLREQQFYLDPEDPLDRELIMQIQEQIEEVNAEIAKLRKRSSELGCA